MTPQDLVRDKEVDNIMKRFNIDPATFYLKFFEPLTKAQTNALANEFRSEYANDYYDRPAQQMRD